jgi:gliding motility-associated-like protein
MNSIFAQNSLVGDGFGGRLWYQPTLFSVGSYSGYTICGDTVNPQQNELYGWGSNSTNQLGLGPTVYGADLPTVIPNMNGVKYFSTGYVMGAIKYDSSGWAWGNASGGGFNQQPVQVISDVLFCDASSLNVSFVKTDGTVWSIGMNDYGNFGNGQEDPYFHSTPIQMLNVNNAVRVANNSGSTCVLLEDSSVVVTGYGNVGLGPTIPSSNIVQPNPFLPKIVDIKSNATGTAALAANGDVYFWGYDGVNIYYSPVKLDSISNIVAISGCDDGYHFLALDSSKNCYAWGDNYNQFGITTPGNVSHQDPVLIATDVIDIMAGETFSYIVKSDGSLWATGGSTAGSIWLNLSNEARSEFTQLNPKIVPGWCTTFNPSDITFPNVFTPNEDGANDTYFFMNYELESLNATILNRWGNTVKTLQNPGDYWDGYSDSGQKCEEGTYYYIVHYKFHGENENWITKHGHITLTR